MLEKSRNIHKVHEVGLDWEGRNVILKTISLKDGLCEPCTIVEKKIELPHKVPLVCSKGRQ